MIGRSQCRGKERRSRREELSQKRLQYKQHSVCCVCVHTHNTHSSTCWGRGDRKIKTSKIKITNDQKEEALRKEVETWSSRVVSFLHPQLSSPTLRCPPASPNHPGPAPSSSQGCSSQREGRERGTQESGLVQVRSSH